jgi:hypothetical protein
MTWLYCYLTQFELTVALLDTILEISVAQLELK